MCPIINIGARLFAQHLALVFVHLSSFDWTSDRGHGAVSFILQKTVFHGGLAVQLAGVGGGVATALGILAWDVRVGQAVAPGLDNQGGHHEKQHGGAGGASQDCKARVLALAR